MRKKNNPSFACYLFKSVFNLSWAQWTCEELFLVYVICIYKYIWVHPVYHIQLEAGQSNRKKKSKYGKNLQGGGGERHFLVLNSLMKIVYFVKEKACFQLKDICWLISIWKKHYHKILSYAANIQLGFW